LEDLSPGQTRDPIGIASKKVKREKKKTNQTGPSSTNGRSCKKKKLGENSTSAEEAGQKSYLTKKGRGKEPHCQGRTLLEKLLLASSRKKEKSAARKG